MLVGSGASAVAAAPIPEITVVGGEGAVSEGVRAFVERASGITVDRVAGADRYETAVAISQQAYPAGADVVFVASGTNFPDALVAVPAAASVGGPILLSLPTGVPQATVDEIARLAPSRIVVLGGTGALSLGVENRLEELAPTVDRLAGASRYGTAVAVSAEFFSPGVPVVFVAGGEGFADALAAGPAAALGGGPVLLAHAELPAETAAELDRLDPASIVIVGGTAGVGETAASQLAAYSSSITRLAGNDRYETAGAVAAWMSPAPTSIVLATSADFPDGLAAGPLAALSGGAVLLTRTDQLAVPTRTRLIELFGIDSPLFGPLPVQGATGPEVLALQELLVEKGLLRLTPDGTYGGATEQAMMALHKESWHTRLFGFVEGDWELLAGYQPSGFPDRPSEPNRIEVDISRQVLFYIVNHEVVATIPISSGNGALYTSTAGGLAVAHTPRGDFVAQRHIVGWRISGLGALWNPWYFTGGYAIHGSPSVPSYPASHGCVRVTIWDSDWLEVRLAVGIPIHVWD